MSEAAFPVPPAPERRPGRGYAMALTAAALWAVNGTVAKVVLVGGLSSLELAELRSTGAFLGLLALLAVAAPRALRVTRRELPALALFGVGGLAFVQLFYFLAIRRLEIGVALLIEYLAPLLVALVARFVLGEHVRRRVWAALALALAGLALIVDVAHGVTLDGPGVAAALAGSVSYAAYVLLAERAVSGRRLDGARHRAEAAALPPPERERRDTLSLLCFGFGFASLFWALVVPWWRFPFDVVAEPLSLLGRLDATALPGWLLALFVVVPGTIVPFVLLIGALRHLPATRVAIAAMAEPVLATVVAWAWLGESLGPAQLAGAAVVLLAILLAQTAR